MASRAFSRSLLSSARSAGNSARAGTATPSSSSARRRPPLFSARNNNQNVHATNFRRRWAATAIPLHNAAANAKLVSHLAVNSTSCSALSLGLQSYIHAPFHALCIARHVGS